MNSFVSTQLLEVILVATRISPMFASVGSGPFQRLPGIIRLTLLIVFSLIIASVTELNTPLPSSLGQLVYVLFFEFIFGLCLAFLLFALLSVFLFWGKVVDMQIGFGAAGVLDPATKVQNSLIGSILLTGAITIFFILGLHSHLIAGIAHSFNFIPLGFNQLEEPMKLVISFYSSVFVFSLVIFLPIIVIMWCFDLFLGYMSRTMPQMNIYFVFLPLKIAVGLFALSSLLNSSSGSFQSLFEVTIKSWDKLVGF